MDCKYIDCLNNSIYGTCRYGSNPDICGHGHRKAEKRKKILKTRLTRSVRSVIDRVLWTANASVDNKRILAEAIVHKVMGLEAGRKG
jgi:hypothetical protein